MFYILKRKNVFEITHYITLYICHFGGIAIFQCNNNRELKYAWLISLRKHGMKLINGRPQARRIQELFKKANAMVKKNINLWQEKLGNRALAYSLRGIYKSINGQKH